MLYCGNEDIMGLGLKDKISDTIFILVKMFPMLLEVIGQHGTYFAFAVVCVVMALFTQSFIPETR